MYVRKFEAETLDAALKAIKQELGPDAIILKTITNKGIKGAFKKNKIEITAAISEKNYTKKAKVDHVLNPDQQGRFYQNEASFISNMIDSHSDKDQNATTSTTNGYGKAGLNRPVLQKNEKEISPKIKSSLDDFLRAREREEQRDELSSASREDIFNERSVEVILPEANDFQEENFSTAESNYIENENFNINPEQEVINSEIVNELEVAKNKIEDLEKKLYQVTKDLERVDFREPIGLFQLRNTLSSFSISNQFIQRIIKKANFEHSKEDLENVDLIFEFALREMMESIHTDLPLFSSVDAGTESAVTVLISESSCGQTSMLQKIAALKEDAVIISFNDNQATIQESTKSFANKFFETESVTAASIAEIVSETRKAADKGKSVFIDYRITSKEENRTKKFVDGLRRSFDNVEVLISLSAIQSELYNKSICNKYAGIANGLVISNVDACLNFGALFNIADQFTTLPYKFFGTGEVVPNDIESASAERILAGVFQFE